MCGHFMSEYAVSMPCARLGSTALALAHKCVRSRARSPRSFAVAVARRVATQTRARPGVCVRSRDSPAKHARSELLL